MRSRLRITSIAAALLVVGSGMSSSAMAADGPTPAPTAVSPAQEEFLFSVQSARATTMPLKSTGSQDEMFRLALRGVDPVTMFADRPFRDATLMSARAFDANWDAWFAGDPPNAVLTFARPGRAPGSMVVELLNSSFDPKSRTLSFTEKRIARAHDPVEEGTNWQRLTTPSSMTHVSLFIDSVCDKPKPGVNDNPCGVM